MKVVDFTEAPKEGHKKTVLLFWAPWHEDSAPGGTMDQVLRVLAESSSSNDDTIQFGRVQAEECSALAQKYSVTAVPTFVLLHASGAVFERLEGGEDISLATQAVQRLIQARPSDDTTAAADDSSTPAISPEEQLSKRLDRLIRSSQVMLFMKGNPSTPRCGFSRQTVELLQEESINFGSFDILSDEMVRQGLKKHSNWPTYPQLYVNGDLVGGLDILKEMKEEGSLREQLGISTDNAVAITAPPKSLDDRLRELVKQEPIMLFLKGLPSAPQCGFSQQIVDILNAENVPFGAFNILQDEEVRQGLKTFSDWPTFPQLYVNGELIGGLDIVKEMQQDGSLKEVLKG